MSLPTSFQRLAWSNLAAQSAEQMSLAAAPILAVLTLGAGAAETGILTAAQSLPFLLLSLPAGVLADRMRRKQLMVMAELLRAAALLTLPVLLWLGVLSLPMLALIGALTATGTVVFSVAAPALVPTLVPRELLAAANTRLELARSLAFAVGPSAAGVLVVAIGGGTRSALWLHMLADATGCPLCVSETAEASALGAGMIAAFGAGWYASINEAAAAMAAPLKAVAPDHQRQRRYAELMQIQGSLYAHNMQVFRDIENYKLKASLP